MPDHEINIGTITRGNRISHHLAASIHRIAEAEADQLAVAIKGEKPPHVRLLVQDKRPDQEAQFASRKGPGPPPKIGYCLNLLDIDRSQRTFFGYILQSGHATCGLAQVALSFPRKAVTGEIEPGLDSQFINQETARRQATRQRARDMPENGVGIIAHKPADQIIDQLRWRDRVGQHHRSSPDLLVRNEAALVAVM